MGIKFYCCNYCFYLHLQKEGCENDTLIFTAFFTFLILSSQIVHICQHGAMGRRSPLLCVSQGAVQLCTGEIHVRIYIEDIYQVQGDATQD